MQPLQTPVDIFSVDPVFFAGNYKNKSVRFAELKWRAPQDVGRWNWWYGYERRIPFCRLQDILEKNRHSGKATKGKHN